MITVVIVDEAEQHLQEIFAWWGAHRPATPNLLLDELERCIRLLQTTPDAGTAFRRTSVPGVRRVIMKRTKHLVYYVHDRDHEIVYIIAVWGAPKHGDPLLLDPQR